MPTLAMPTAGTQTSSIAQRTADQNWKHNFAALQRTQPDVAETLRERREIDAQLNLQWMFCRDGTLGAMTADQKWHGGCSVPLLAGQAILKSLESSDVNSALLAPDHVGLVLAARHRMGTSPALFVIQPDEAAARMILSCYDFSHEISVYRLWMVCGPDWAEQLNRLLDIHPRLATPARFIRTKFAADESVGSMITAAQKVFTDILARRGEQLTELQSQLTQCMNSKSILCIGPSEFRLWDDAANILHAQLQLHVTEQSEAHQLARFDTDAALCGSPLALLHASKAAGCVVTANLFRADCNHLVSTDIPWITWLTQPAIPAHEKTGPRDALILADQSWASLAIRAGWPKHQVHFAAWPAEKVVSEHPTGLALISNTRPIELPSTVKDFSSHRLLWELIEEELHLNPLAVEFIEEYLNDRAGQLNIDPIALDRRAFVQGLIQPAYEQGLARLLIAEGLPVVIYGNGWSDLPEFANHFRGSITKRADLTTAISNAAALIHCWLQQAPDLKTRNAHPIESWSKPILYRTAADRAQLTRTAKRLAVSNMLKPPNQMVRDAELAKVVIKQL